MTLIMVGFKSISRLLRPTHWIKAIFVLLGVLYANEPAYWPKALAAAFVFCLIASAVYIYNDLQDLEEDRQHPLKKQRPLASGQVSMTVAVFLLILLLGLGLTGGFLISPRLGAILSVYLIVNFFYNHGLRAIPVFDVLCIASGFLLRILAGTLGIGLPITWWLLATATLFCLFIALSKRRLEMKLPRPSSSRPVLRKYPPRLLDQLIGLTAVSSFIAYLAYVLYPNAGSIHFLLTLPFVAYGLWRFTQLTTQENQSDDPLVLVFSDRASCFNLFCFFILTLKAVMV